MSSRILSAVAAMYGKDSKEYAMAGGTPPRRGRRRKTPATESALPTPEPTAVVAPVEKPMTTTMMMMMMEAIGAMGNVASNGVVRNGATAIASSSLKIQGWAEQRGPITPDHCWVEDYGILAISWGQHRR